MAFQRDWLGNFLRAYLKVSYHQKAFTLGSFLARRSACISHKLKECSCMEHIRLWSVTF